MEERITDIENNISRIEQIFAKSDFYEKYGEQTAELTAELQHLKSELETLFARWQELEDLKNC